MSLRECCRDYVSCRCISVCGKPGCMWAWLTTTLWLCMTERDFFFSDLFFFFFKLEKLCSGKVSHFSQFPMFWWQNTSCDIYYYCHVLLLLPSLPVRPISLFCFNFQKKNFALSLCLKATFFFLWIWFGRVQSFSKGIISSRGTLLRCQSFGTYLRVDELLGRWYFDSSSSAPTLHFTLEHSKY